ncbi:serine hydrolase domain-containing protein [Kitasatospora sp. McL0602]|uniref:serine hydrolase domain-containing protein n=1 Tax=Kitasatospora sp. McL0602 TaxID=3439530 RepID=UPI003F8B9991
MPDWTATTWTATTAATLRRALDQLTGSAIPGALPGVFPGGVITLGTVGGPRHTLGSGVVAPECGDATPDGRTHYDLASLTKVLAVWPLVGRAVSRGLLDLDAPLHAVDPQLPPPGRDLTVRQLITHTSGLLPHTRLDRYRGRATPLAQLICAEPLAGTPGAQHRYIDRGFILLGLLLGTLHGRELHDLADEFWRETSLPDTRYGPLARAPRVAPTQPRLAGAPRLWGTVHDPSAALLGGVAGHAGVFSTTADLAVFAEHALGSRWLAESVSPAVPVGPGLRRGLAWLVTDDGAVAYHHGFTGTSLHLGLHTGRYVAICTNAVYHGWERGRLAPLRTLALEAVRRRP